jgi:transcriptional regulator with XRE-family HTH domain
MSKEKLGKEIKALRKKQCVSTYEIEKKGLHSSLPATIEKGQKGYTIDTLIAYLEVIGLEIKIIIKGAE